jgi:hypothetical protein
MQDIGKTLMTLAFSLSLIGCFVNDEAQILAEMDNANVLPETADESEHPMNIVENDVVLAPSAVTQYDSIRNGSIIFEEAWYNPADANLSKGRNSFTLKDWGCYDRYDGHIIWTGARAGSRTVSCGEASFSIEPNNVAHAAIKWRLCYVDRFDNDSIWCRPWKDSYID